MNHENLKRDLYAVLQKHAAHVSFVIPESELTLPEVLWLINHEVQHDLARKSYNEPCDTVINEALTK